MYPCDVCKKLFTRKPALYRHLRNVHSVVPVYEKDLRKEDEGWSLKCNLCTSVFKAQNNLNKHIRKAHGGCASEIRKKSSSEAVISRIKCPECSVLLASHIFLRSHLNTVHDTILDKEEKTFLSMQEFKTWQLAMEKETRSLYTSSTGAKRLSGDRKKYSYQCHRSGHYTSQSKGKNKVKSQGTNKIGSTCPSMIEVVETATEVQVLFYKTHCSHSDSAGRLNLTKEERTRIAGKIAAGVTMERIIDEISDENLGEITTKSLKTKQQLLRNIRRDFKLHAGWQHSSDSTGAQLLLKNLVEKINRLLGYATTPGNYSVEGIRTADKQVEAAIESLKQSQLSYGEEYVSLGNHETTDQNVIH